MNITRKYEVVTPEVAKKWLATSVGNRPISANRVALFAQAMAAGEWNRDAQAVYFDENGCLMDGHTRLHAVVKSGVTVEMDVKRYFPRAEWDKLNSAHAWTPGDFASANGVKSARSAMGAVRVREALRQGLHVGSENRRNGQGLIWTNEGYLEAYTKDDDWPADVEFARTLYRQWYGIPVTICAGVLHHLTRDCGWPRGFVCEFFRQVYTLEGLTVNTQTLRKRMDQERVAGTRLRPNYVCLLICKAFEGYAHNTPKSRIAVSDPWAVCKFPKNS